LYKTLIMEYITCFCSSRG